MDVHKWKLGHPEISKEEEQLVAYTSRYTIIRIEEGEINQKLVVSITLGGGGLSSRGKWSGQASTTPTATPSPMV